MTKAWPMRPRGRSKKASAADAGRSAKRLKISATTSSARISGQGGALAVLSVIFRAREDCPLVEEIVETEGHLIDSRLMTGIFDAVVKHGASFEVIEFAI